MNRKTIAYALIFLLGATAGALGDRWSCRWAARRPPNPARIESRLTRELSLDDSQRAKLHRILEDASARLREIHRRAREDFEAQRRDDHGKIRAILDPVQQAKFDALTRKWDERTRRATQRNWP